MGLRLKKLTQTLESKHSQQYNFPRGVDQFEYSPDRSYSSLQGDIYDLNSQLRHIHRRVLSQVVFQKGKSKENKISTLSPLKVDQLAATKAKLNSQRFFLMNQVQKYQIQFFYLNILKFLPTLRNIRPKQNKMQSSQMIMQKSTQKKGQRMHTETIESITKYRLG